MKTWYLYVLVFVSGATVLAVEILGTRILGPFYGVGLFLWSALITVTLAALSVGYVLGGRWADKGPSITRLCYVVAGAGLWLLFVPWLKYPVLSIAEPFGLRFAVLVAALILFAPPLTLLGMVSPYAIRLKASHLEEVGRTAGDLYAVSTIASVIAALLTGFFLIPNVGVQRLMLMIGVIVLITAALGLLVHRRSKGTTAISLGMWLIGAVVLWTSPAERAAPERGLLAVEQSAYAEIRVVDLYGRRHLVIDGASHTIVNPTTWQTVFPYVAVMNLTRGFFEQPGTLLLVGLGGGTLVKDFAREGWGVHAIEIDPVVTKLARLHFGLMPSEGRVAHMDGRRFLLTHKRPYDIIILDAFGSSSIPFHLITLESFGLIASRLNPDGVLAINMEANGWEDLIVRSLAATLRPHFSEVLALPLAASEEEFGSVILLASNRSLELRHELSELNASPTASPWLRRREWQRRAWDSRFVPEARGAPVLTDDLNPVDLWSEQLNLIARKGLHRYFEEERLSW